MSVFFCKIPLLKMTSSNIKMGNCLERITLPIELLLRTRQLSSYFDPVGLAEIAH